MLESGKIVELDDSVTLTNGMFRDLCFYKSRTGNITWKTIAAWLGTRLELKREPTESYVSSSYKRLHEKFLSTVRNNSSRDKLLNDPFPCPLSSQSDDSSSFEAVNQNVLDMPNYKQCAQELYIHYEEMFMINDHLATLLEDIQDSAGQAEKEKQKKINQLQAELEKMKAKYAKLNKDLKDKSEALSHYYPRNVNKREKRKEERITNLSTENKELKNFVDSLEEKLLKVSQNYEKERKKCHYYKHVAWKAANNNNNKELRNLQQSVSSLENENEKLKEEIEGMLEKDYIQTFKDGKFTKEIRMVYYDLLSMNLSVRNCEKVIRCVLEKLGNTVVDKLPSKSVASRLMVESRVLAQMQVADAMLEGSHNVLHMDGTKYNFEEKGSFQIVTPSGAYTMLVEDMLSGEAECYLDTFRDILTEMASLLVTPEKVEGKVSELLTSIKNLMTDRVVTNKSFCSQLKQWREKALPHVIKNYNELSDEEKKKLATINHVFCGLHVIHNLGIYAEAAMREFVKLAASIEKHSGFVTNNSRVYDLLYEISKLCSYTHGDQRNGQAAEWKAFLSKLGIENTITSFLHHRFNIYFVLGGAAYYHRGHLKEFPSRLQSTNFLHTSIAGDIENPIYLAGFRALGIFNKLVTGPLWRKVEEDGHIFDLNPVWLQFKQKLEGYGSNASPLLDKECPIADACLTNDEVFEELFRETHNPEFDALTQECLEIISCTCALVITNQLADQLPGGKFYQPSNEIVNETALCKRTNILSERDFDQMDRKFHQKPNITTIAASGVIMFLNNKTSKWLKLKSEEEQAHLVDKAMQMTPERIKLYKEKRKSILRARINSQERKKLATKVGEQAKATNKEELCKEIEKIGGLWTTKEQMEANLSGKEKKQQLEALKLQINFRKAVLEVSVPDKKLLQMGTTIDKKRKEFSVSELKENLGKIIDFCSQSPEASVEEMSTISIRSEGERRVLLDDAKRSVMRKIKESTDAASAEEPARKKPKKRFPKLFGKRIMHKWDEDGEEVWYEGTVIEVYDEDEYDVDCEFGVKYDNIDGIFEVRLLQDFKRNWLIVVRAANEEEIKACKTDS